MFFKSSNSVVMYIYIASCDTRTKEKESKTRLIRDLSENLSVGLFNRLVLQMSEVQIRKRIYTERIVRRLRELSRTLCWCGSFCWQMLGGPLHEGIAFQSASCSFVFLRWNVSLRTSRRLIERRRNGIEMKRQMHDLTVYANIVKHFH